MEKEPTPTPLSGFVLLGVAVVLVSALLFVIWRGLAALDSTVAAAVIAASATVLISVVSLIYSKAWEQRRAIEEAQREHKRGVYEEFIQFLFRTITETPGEEEIQRFATEFHPKLILWGSDELVSEYVAFRLTAALLETDESESHPEILFSFERLLYSVRSDLGHANKRLGRGDLLRVFINDVDDFMEPPSGTAGTDAV